MAVNLVDLGVVWDEKQSLVQFYANFSSIFKNDIIIFFKVILITVC